MAVAGGGPQPSEIRKEDGMSVHQTKDKRWYATYRDNNIKQVKAYFGRGKEGYRQAKAYDLEIKRKKELREKNLRIARKDMRFRDLAQEWLNYKSMTISDSSIKATLYKLNRHVLPLFGNLYVSELSNAILVKYVEGRRQQSHRRKPVKPSTVNRELDDIQAILNWGVKMGLINDNPVRGFEKLKVMKEPVTILTLNEFGELLRCSPPHLQWVLIVEYYTGCRPGPSELFSLEWEHIDWEADLLVVRAPKTRNFRHIAINSQFRLLLEQKYQERDCKYICSYKGKKIKSIRRSFREALRKAGITKKVRPYDLRHMFGTYLARYLADMVSIQSLMGHADFSTTRRYLHASEELKRKAVEQLPQLPWFENVPQSVPQSRDK